MYGIIGVLIQGLIGAIAITLPTLIKRLAISLGVGVVVFTGTHVLMNHVSDLSLGTLHGLPALVGNVAGILNIDKAFNIIISAISIKFTFKTLGGVNPKQIGLF